MPDSRDFASEASEFKAWPLERRQQPEPAQRPQTLPFAARSSYVVWRACVPVAGIVDICLFPAFVGSCFLKVPRRAAALLLSPRYWIASVRVLWGVVRVVGCRWLTGWFVVCRAMADVCGCRSYQDDYVAHEMPPRQAAPPAHRPPPKIPFNARTVSQDDFQAHPIPRKKFVTLIPAV